MVIHLFNWYNASQYNFVPNVLFRSAFPAAATSAERQRLCANLYLLLITLSLVSTHKHIHLQAGEHTTAKKKQRNKPKKKSTTALMMQAAGFLGQQGSGTEEMLLSFREGNWGRVWRQQTCRMTCSHRSTQYRSRQHGSVGDVCVASFAIAIKLQTYCNVPSTERVAATLRFSVGHWLKGCVSNGLGGGWQMDLGGGGTGMT